MGFVINFVPNNTKLKLMVKNPLKRQCWKENAQNWLKNY